MILKMLQDSEVLGDITYVDARTAKSVLSVLNIKYGCKYRGDKIHKPLIPSRKNVAHKEFRGTYEKFIKSKSVLKLNTPEHYILTHFREIKLKIEMYAF